MFFLLRVLAPRGGAVSGPVYARPVRQAGELEIARLIKTSQGARVGRFVYEWPEARVRDGREELFAGAYFARARASPADPGDRRG